MYYRAGRVVAEWLSLLRWRDVRDGKIPMREKDLETTLLLASKRGLIGPELLDHRRLVGIGRRRHRRVAEGERDAIVPARLLGHVIRGRLDLHRENATALDFFLEQRVVVLEEQLQEFLLPSPLRFVVVLHRVRLICRALRW